MQFYNSRLCFTSRLRVVAYSRWCVIARFSNKDFVWLGSALEGETLESILYLYQLFVGEKKNKCFSGPYFSFNTALRESDPLQIWLFKASDPSSLVDVSAEDIANNFLVSEITPETKEEAIVIHFQKHKHGDGWLEAQKKLDARPYFWMISSHNCSCTHQWFLTNSMIGAFFHMSQHNRWNWKKKKNSRIYIYISKLKF